MAEQEIETTNFGGNDENAVVQIKTKKNKKPKESKNMDDLKKEAEMVSSTA